MGVLSLKKKKNDVRKVNWCEENALYFEVKKWVCKKGACEQYNKVKLKGKGNINTILSSPSYWYHRRFITYPLVWFDDLLYLPSKALEEGGLLFKVISCQFWLSS